MRALLFLLFVGVAISHAGEPDDLGRAITLHHLGVEGDKEAAAQCATLLEAAHKAAPEDPLIKVWLGSAYTLRARDLTVGPSKLETLRLGGRLMDEAVEAAPDNPKVRLVRAMNSYHLPAIFGRKKVARADFLLLLEGLEDSTALTLEERQQIYYYAGLAMRDARDGDGARATWKKGLALDDQSKTAEKIRARLR